MKTIIGIIGGMGPMVTCDLMKKIISHTDARVDQEHVHLLVDCNTDIPDRTAAIIGSGESPLPEMIKSASRLQAMGAQALVISCNTAHYFLEDLKKSVDIPIISILHETANYLLHCGVHSVAVLGTDGTIQSGVYGNALKSMGISYIYPSSEDQQLIMSFIYDYVKAGKEYPHPEKINDMVDRLKNQGAQALVLGCTELPILFANLDVKIPLIDPTDILARAAILFAQANLKQEAV